MKWLDNSMQEIGVGIDAGGTWIKAGVVSVAGEVLGMVKVESGAAQGRIEYIKSIDRAIQELTDQYVEAKSKNMPIGLAIPALLTTDRRAIRAMANVKGLESLEAPVSVRELLAGSEWAERVKIVENDAGAAAWAEWKKAGSNTNEKMLLVTWGTGIGTALISNGCNQSGWEGGHIPIESSKGDVLEKKVAVPAIIKRVADRMKITNDMNEAPKQILQAAIKGDLVCREEIYRAAEWLAWGIQVWSVIACPDMVRLGGAFVADDWIVEEVRAALDRVDNDFMRMVIKPEMVQKAALGNQAGIVGAAQLALGSGD